MKDKDAIKILQQLITEQKTIGNNLDVVRNWLIKVKSIIKEIFSADSVEYRTLVHHNLEYQGGEDWKQKHDLINLTHALPQYVDTVKLKGTYKPPKKNFLRAISDSWLIFICTLLIGSVIGMYHIGYWFGEHSSKSFTNLTNNKETAQPANKPKDTTKKK